MIRLHNITKRYGATTAVDQLTFEVKPGVVTGFLGPNGAGKTTTIRMILGLDRPTSGEVTVNGRSYRQSPAPPREVGAMLDAKAVQGGRTARQHLTWVARAGRIDFRRIDEMLDLVGLTDVADRKVGEFSLGMCQRLGIATAMLGDPEVLLFDEPANGLDPEGIRWVRSLFQNLAREGRTILVSSHLMSEMEETADHVLVIGRGRLIADANLHELTQANQRGKVRVSCPEPDRLKALLITEGATVQHESGALVVAGIHASRIGEIAAAHSIVLHELAPQRASLEATFMELTRNDVEFTGSPAFALEGVA